MPVAQFIPVGKLVGEGHFMAGAKFQPGETVAVPAAVHPGAFSGEYLITIPTKSGPVSGFARERDFVEPGKTISAVVRTSTPELLIVQLAGSYFTTNGTVEFPLEWAKSNVHVIA